MAESRVNISSIKGSSEAISGFLDCISEIAAEGDGFSIRLRPSSTAKVLSSNDRKEYVDGLLEKPADPFDDPFTTIITVKGRRTGPGRRAEERAAWYHTRLMAKKRVNDDYTPSPAKKAKKDLMAPRNLGKTYVPKQEQQKKMLAASQHLTPRFLFRGFGSQSGGGGDLRLNSKKAIIPHAFLDGKAPTGMFDTPDLKEIINGHLQYRTVQTVFSSWAADLPFSISFTEGKSDACIAVLDTEITEDHVEVHSVTALYHAGLAEHQYPQEYLVYGPVRGPAFRCVTVAEMERAGFHACTGSGLPLDPNSPCRAAKKIAKLFYNKKAGNEEAVVTVAAALLGIQLGAMQGNKCDESRVRSAAKILAPHLDAIFRRSPPVKLVNPLTLTNQSKSLAFMIDLLVALERRIRNMGDPVGPFRPRGCEWWTNRDDFESIGK